MPNIFPTHGETNKFVYWMKNRIQFYHYNVLRILCPISLYTFLNKLQIKENKNYLPTMISKIIFNLNYQIMEKEPVWELTIFLCNRTRKHRESHRGRGYHLKNLFFFFFNPISFLINDKIMEKEPVRVLTPFQCDGTKITLGTTKSKSLPSKKFVFSFSFFFSFLSFPCVGVGVCVCVCVTK